MKKSNIVFLAVATALIGLFAIYGIMEKAPSKKVTYDDAVSRLDDLLNKVTCLENIVKRRANVRLGNAHDIKSMLPEIDQFELLNPTQISAGDVVVEIFVSTEKSGKGTDGWMVEAAQAFNAQNPRLNGGQRGKVRIRRIASGTGYQFISSRKYLPDAFSPSSHLWIQMAAAHDVTMTPIREKTVGNIAGIVIKTSVAEQLKATYGTLDIKNLIDAVVQGNLAMGYTNPFASSTGLNFLFTVLATFADGNEDLMLSPMVISAFESFQRGVPFVSLTTLQMRESVQNDGSLDAFVMEYQTFIKTASLQSGYEFIPFGIRHDNPLYAVGQLSPEKLEVLEQFAGFAEQPRFQKMASDFGFNPSISYTPSFQTPSGTVLVQAQKIWKQKKDAGRPVSAIFLCDVSGSMGGTRLQALKKSLIEGKEFIAPENSIGLVLFNDRVSVVLPVQKFNLSHKAAFQAAVEDMDAEGGTAMYDGIAVALSLLVKEKKRDPNAKTTLFVLTDGESQQGLNFEEIRPVIEGLKIPVYTIGYEANLQVLQQVSSIVEAASIKAEEGEIQYKIGSLLNAQM